MVIKNYLNPEGHWYPISGSKVTVLLTEGVNFASWWSCIGKGLRSRLVLKPDMEFVTANTILVTGNNYFCRNSILIRSGGSTVVSIYRLDQVGLICQTIKVHYFFLFNARTKKNCSWKLIGRTFKFKKKIILFFELISFFQIHYIEKLFCLHKDNFFQLYYTTYFKVFPISCQEQVLFLMLL